MHKRDAFHESGPAFGPCPGISTFACQGNGTARLDPAGTTLDLVVMCSGCAAVRELEAGDPTPIEQELYEADRLYGMGAAA